MKSLLIFTVIYFNQAIIFAQNVQDHYFFMTQVNTKLQNNDYFGAIQILNMAIKQFPDDELFYLNLGASYVSVKDYYSAISNTTKAIEASKKHIKFYLKSKEETESANEIIHSAYGIRAYSKLRVEDYFGAISDYEQVIVFNPNDASAYYNRGLAKISVNQRKEGCIDLSRAGELGFADTYRAIKLYCH